MESFFSRGLTWSFFALYLLSLGFLASLSGASSIPARPARGARHPFDVRRYTSTSPNNTEVSSQNSTTLIPAVHWEYPVNDIRNLAPINSTDLYYSANGVSDPSVKHLFASLSASLQHDAVVLDHSSYVRDVQCEDNNIQVGFTTPEAFRFAANTWPHAQDFVLVTYTDGCGVSNTQRTFWLIDSITLSNSTTSISAEIQREVAIENAFQNVTLVWGTYHPPEGNATGKSASDASTGNNGSPCGSAPNSTIDGFPAVECGAADFDQKLDKAIGVWNSSESSSLIPRQVNSRYVAVRGSRHLSRRGFFHDLKSISSSIVSKTEHAGDAAASAISHGTKTIVNAGKTVIDSITNPQVSKSADINMYPPADSHAPWSNAALIFGDETTDDDGEKGELDVYCVDCGVRGHVSVAGSAQWGLSGLSALEAQVDADIEAGVKIAIDASVSYKDTKSKSLLNQAIPDLGFSVDNVFSAGVYLTIEASATLELDAKSEILAGVTMKLPNFSADLNILNTDAAKSSKISGATPDWEKTFEVKDSVTASAVLSLPIGLHIGVQIPPINWDKSVALIEEPNLTGKLTSSSSGSCKGGVDYSITAGNDIKLDLFGVDTISLEHAESPPLVSGCYQTSSKRDMAELSGARHHVRNLVFRRDNGSIAPDNGGNVTYTAVKELHNSFQIVPGSDGNVYTKNVSSSNTTSSASVSPTDAVWATYSSAVLGDNQNRLLYYFPDTMAAFNVSRLRLGNETQIPATAQPIALVSDSNLQNALFAATKEGQSFGLAKCDFANGAYSKLFVANGDQALQTLTEDNLRYTVTGANVTQCDWVALVMIT